MEFDSNIKVDHIDYENAMLLLAVRNNAILNKSLKMLVEIKSLIEGEEKDPKELIRLALIDVQHEMIKTLDELPKVTLPPDNR